MQFLIDYLNENQSLRRFVPEAMSQPGVQGIMLDVDDEWLKWHSAVQRFGRQRAQEEFQVPFKHFPFPWQFWFPFFGKSNDLEYYQPRLYRPLTVSDLQDRPPYWSEYCRLRGMKSESPIIVIVRLRESVPSPESALDKLSNEDLRVEFEARGPARLQAGPKSITRPLVGGLSVGTGPSSDGTLGGMLRDKTTHYGLTCAHVVPGDMDVVDQPAQSDSGSAHRVGKRCYGTPLQVLPSRSVCNPFDPTCLMNETDAALVELDAGVSGTCDVMGIGPIAGIKAKAAIKPREAVQFAGKVSGSRSRVVGPLGVVYEFVDRNGSAYCFRNVFELRRKRGRAPSKSGDSGAWVCGTVATAKGGYEWYGMLIGGDDVASYAVFAEVVKSWYETKNASLAPAY